MVANIWGVADDAIKLDVMDWLQPTACEKVDVIGLVGYRIGFGGFKRIWVVVTGKDGAIWALILKADSNNA